MSPAPLDRLSALDATFLALDAPAAPMHVGWTMRFAGPPPPLAQLRRHVDARLAHVPRFRRRVVVPPLGLGDPRWADDPGFDVAHHVHEVTVEAPGGPGELRELAGVLLSTPLDPTKPLWRMYLAKGLARDEFALIGQAHHALVDGIAAIEVAMLLFAPEHEHAERGAASWRPERGSGLSAAARGAVEARAKGSMDAARHVARRAWLNGPYSLHAAGSALRDAGAAIEALTRVTSQTALDRNVTHRRAVAYAETSLEGIREAGKRHHATVNDVLLAACTLALGRALRRRGEDHDDLKILVPVSTRAAGAAGDLGNRISFMAVDLPVSEIDAVTVLRKVRNRTRAAKGSNVAAPLDAVARAADLLPTAGARAVARGAWKAASFSAVISNVPGPPIELSLLGRPLRSVHPAVPVPEGRGLAIGAVSYGERLHVGLYADAEVVPDAVDLARDIEGAFDVLRVEAPDAPTPWRARATAKRARLRAVR